mmetsp:Transcript_9894/g.20040  ORF Transcript_9894/g.20040 Transcript_9894/m.20040 type:complete len:216 (-) Transcript_9894:88-735(-)
MVARKERGLGKRCTAAVSASRDCGYEYRLPMEFPAIMRREESVGSTARPPPPWMRPWAVSSAGVPIINELSFFRSGLRSLFRDTTKTSSMPREGSELGPCVVRTVPIMCTPSEVATQLPPILSGSKCHSLSTPHFSPSLPNISFLSVIVTVFRDATKTFTWSSVLVVAPSKAPAVLPTTYSDPGPFSSGSVAHRPPTVVSKRSSELPTRCAMGAP